MYRTALLMTAASLALAACWEDETAADTSDDVVVTEETAASEAQIETQPLEGALPIEAADVPEQLDEETAADLSERLAEEEETLVAEARAEADATSTALAERRAALEEEIATLRADAINQVRNVQATEPTAEAREAAVRAELAAQRAEAALAELLRENDMAVAAEDVSYGRLDPFLGAWAEDPSNGEADWVIGRDTLIWAEGACAIAPTETTARFELRGCGGGEPVLTIDLSIADDVLTVASARGTYDLRPVTAD